MKKIKTGALFTALALIVSLCLPSDVSAHTDDAPYVVTGYNEQNGLPTGEANTVIQTSDGYIWIGSYGGLIRYDGANIRNYSVEGDITSSSIRALFEDSKGRLWIGTNDAGVVMLENDVFTEIASPEDNSFLCIRDFTEDKDGNIYAASNSGIAAVADGKLVPFEAEEVSGNTVYSIAVDSRGRIWGSMNSGDCAVIENGSLECIFESERIFDEDEIYSLDNDKNGNIVMGTSGSTVAVVSFDAEEIDGFSVIETYSPGLVATHNSVSVAENGEILVSGINGFAVIDNGILMKEFGESHKAMSVNAAIIDYEDNYWLASSSYGIIKYSRGCYDTTNGVSGLENISLNAIAGQNGNWYIATDTGMLVFDKDWNRIENELTEAFDGIRVRCVVSDDKGNVWVASYSDDAVVCFDTTRSEIIRYNESNGLVGDRMRVVTHLSDGRIAAGSQTGVTIIENGVVTETYTYEDGLENPSVLCLYEGDNGSVLMGSDGAGIYELSGGKVKNYSFAEGLGEGVVLRMLKSEKGGWFVSAGSSLYYWADGKFSRLSNFTKSAGSIFDLYEIDGMLWILQNNGFIAMNVDQLLSGGQTDILQHDLSHGLTGSINANTWHCIAEDGKLYMSTRNGVSVFGFEGVQHKLPKMIVNRISVDGESYEHPDKIKISSNAQRITIDFSALSYTAASERRIAYKLKGFDKEETIISDSGGVVSYTNLPGGTYTFEAAVYSLENPDEKVICSLRIIKPRRIYEEPLFWTVIILLVALVSAGIVILATRAKTRKIKERQQEYKRITEQSLRTFAKTIDAKDSYTNGHSIRVAEYSKEIARRMGKDDEEQENIYYVALLHDIGKIGIPDNILNKPGKLTDEERAFIQRHVDIGEEILEEFTDLEGIADGVKYHHERFDGKGYCRGLSGKDIPEVARIICVADTYDAMSSDRCYRKALSNDVIYEELKTCSGTQFDPEIVPHMLSMIEEGIVPFRD